MKSYGIYTFCVMLVIGFTKTNSTLHAQECIGLYYLDLNDDFIFNDKDTDFLLSYWGTAVQNYFGNRTLDFNNDGIVDVLDYTTFLAYLMNHKGKLVPAVNRLEALPDLNSITLRWTDLSASEGGFSIERTVSGSWTEIAKVPFNAEFYQDVNVAAGVRYVYRIRAYADKAEDVPYYSCYSDAAVASTAQQAGVDLSVSRIEINQAIQKWGSPEVPLVAGKPTVVRVYIDIGPNNGPVSAVTGKLYIYQNGTLFSSQPYLPSPSLIRANKNPSQNNITETLNFYLDAGLPSGTYDFKVVLDPANSIQELSEGNNENFKNRVRFYNRRGLQIIYYLIKPTRNTLGGYLIPRYPKIDNNPFQFLIKIYPMPNALVNYREAGKFEWDGNIANSAQRNLLLNNLKLRLAIHNLVNSKKADIALGFVPENSMTKSMFSSPRYGISQWQPQIKVALVDDTPSHIKKTIAHEAGHLVLKINDSIHNSDEIGLGGIDVLNKDYVSEHDYDIMNAAPPTSETWIKRDTWEGLLIGLSILPPVNTLTLLSGYEGISRVSDLIVISGLILPGPIVQNGAFYRFQGDLNPSVSDSGSYNIELWDASKNVLTTHAFDPAFGLAHPDSNDSIYPFFAVLPYHLNTASIVFKHNGSLMKEITVSRNSPTVNVLQPKNAEQVSGSYPIKWNTNDLDGDSLSHSVLYSPNGTDWMILATELKDTSYVWDTTAYPGGANCRIRVLTTDGVNTAQDDSDGAFSVTLKAPTVGITTPADSLQFQYGNEIIFQGFGYDSEDGVLSASALRWTSNLDGNIGNGELVNISSLSTGTHRITLIGVDSHGMSNSDFITVFVSPSTGVDQKSLTIPDKFDLVQNYPNPFNQSTFIKFQLPRNTQITLTIYNALGQRVRTLMDEHKQAGVYITPWDGRNSSGIYVPSGLYFVRMNAHEFTKTIKILVLR